MEASQLAGMSTSQRVAAAEASSLKKSDIEKSKLIENASQGGALVVGAGIAAYGGMLGIAAFGAGTVGAIAGGTLAKAVHADSLAARGLQAAGMHRIAAGGPKAARKGDQVAHSYAAAGFFASAVLGAAIALAVGAAIVATGGLAAVAIVGAAAAGGFAAGFLCTTLSGALAQVGTQNGPITSGSSNVLINGKPAVRMTDIANCNKESSPTQIIQGCKNVLVNGLPMVRVGHKLACGATVDEGSSNVLLNDTVAACGAPAPEVPLWLKVACDWGAVLFAGAIAARAGRRPTLSTEVEGENVSTKKTCASDPVDVATGEFVDSRTDIEIKGVLPLRLRRTYASNRTNSAGGLFGPRWSDSFSTCLVRGKSTLTYWDEEGVGLVFDTPSRQLNSTHLSAPSLLLQGTQEAPILLNRNNGTSTRFVWHGEVARLAEVTDSYGNSYRFVYERQRLLRIEHSQGYRVDFHRLEGVATAASGAQSVLSVSVQETGRLPIEVVRYGFDQQGRLISGQSEFSGKIYYRYDFANRIINWGDASRTHVSLKYGTDGRVAEVVTPGGIHGGSFEYDTAQRRTKMWAAGKATTFDYNEDNLVIRCINPLGQTTFTTWDTSRRKTSETNRLGQVTRYEYDGEGRLSNIIDWRNRTTKAQYDSAGRLASLTFPDGRKQQWEYDSGGRIISAIDKNGATSHNAFDQTGRLIASAAPNGNVTYYEYDIHGNPCARVGANGVRSEWKQDLLGRITESISPTGEITRCEYAPIPAAKNANLLAAQAPVSKAHRSPLAIVYPTGERVSYAYDQEGLLSTATDAAGGKVRYVWGAYDLLVSRTDQAGCTTRYEYDGDARLARVINAQGDSWHFVYDSAGQLVQETDFNQRTTRYQYDASGRPQGKVVANWLHTRYSWDEFERIVSIDTDDRRITYDYDEQDRVICAKRLDGVEVESEIRWTYDKVGRIVKTVQDGKEISRNFDTNGYYVTRHTPAGSSRRTHDAFGLLKSLHTDFGDIFIERDQLGLEVSRSSVPLNTLQQQSEPSSLIRNLALPPHFHLQQQYDAIGRLLEQQVGAISSVNPSIGSELSILRHYNWQDGNLVGIDDPRFGDVHYANDARGQIVRTDYDLQQGSRLREPSVAQETFAYDSIGNIRSRDLTTPNQLNAQHRAMQHVYLQGKVVRCGDISYRYDQAGRMIERTHHSNGFRPQTWEFDWDGFDRMVGVRTPKGEIWRYTYDALGRRTGKQCVHSGKNLPRADQIRREMYLWDGATLAVQWKVYADGSSEAGSGSSVRTETLAWHHHPGTFKPLAVSYQRNNDSPELLHIVTDHLGTPREAIRNNGEVIWAAQPQTWGSINQRWKPRKKSNIDLGIYTNADATNDDEYQLDLRLPNQWEDEETGLFYNCQRYYDPLTGQYVSSDPIGFAGGLKPHAYVPNPVTWVDPLGLNGCEDEALGTTANPKPVYLPGHTEAEILAIPKGSRPDPATYLDPDYIANHLQKYSDTGGGFLFTDADIANPKYPTFNPYKFVMPGSELDAVVAQYQATGDVSVIETALGYDPGYLAGKDIYMLKLDDPNVIMPTGNEGGAFDLWRPGGLTYPGGMTEAVLNNVPIFHGNDVANLPGAVQIQ